MGKGRDRGCIRGPWVGVSRRKRTLVELTYRMYVLHETHAIASFVSVYFYVVRGRNSLRQFSSSFRYEQRDTGLVYVTHLQKLSLVSTQSYIFAHKWKTVSSWCIKS